MALLLPNHNSGGSEAWELQVSCELLRENFRFSCFCLRAGGESKKKRAKLSFVGAQIYSHIEKPELRWKGFCWMLFNITKCLKTELNKKLFKHLRCENLFFLEGLVDAVLLARGGWAVNSNESNDPCCLMACNWCLASMGRGIKKA